MLKDFAMIRRRAQHTLVSVFRQRELQAHVIQYEENIKGSPIMQGDWLNQLTSRFNSCA